MKKTGILIFVAAMMVFAASCKKEENKTYYYAIGIINIKADSTIIVADNGDRLWVRNPAILGTTIKDQDRLNINFYTLDETLPTNIDYIIEIASAQKILLKPITLLTPAIEDSVGNDPLQINSLWLSSDFLNLDFGYFGGYAKHYIHLVRPDGDIPTDTVDLEIRHNNNSDSGTGSYYAFASFNLTTLQNNTSDSVKLRITAKEFNNRTFEKIFTYKY